MTVDVHIKCFTGIQMCNIVHGNSTGVEFVGFNAWIGNKSLVFVDFVFLYLIRILGLNILKYNLLKFLIFTLTSDNTFNFFL